jgi:glycogen(starch) synthase
MPEDRPSRGRIVMIVDNGVEGDSRVQKQARSAADRGWDVILLGCAKQPRRWRIGDARVRLLAFDNGMAQRTHEHRPNYLRHPLAYRNMKLARYRELSIRGRKSDLRARIAEATLGGRFLRRSLLNTALFASRVEGRWIAMRSVATSRVHSSRREMTGGPDKAGTWAWEKLYGQAAWRRLDPHLLEYEAVFGPVLDQLRPDIIHANDFRMLGVGARSALRARAEGRRVKLVWDAHEFLPGIRPWNSHPRWHRAQILHERQYARYADAVITVTEPLADLLVAEHGLGHPPTVVLNAPFTADLPDQEAPIDIRTACELGEDTPLLVYSGAAAPQRGLDTMVEALPDLPGVHAAFVVRFPPRQYVQDLVASARRLGVLDRLHVLPYVPVEQIVPFLRTATIGVIPAHKWPNHEISLGTKFFEYSHAGLPIITSNIKAMADMVTKTGQGEVFTAQDTADYVDAVRRILADPAKYRAPYDDADLLATWTWEHQADILESVYAALTPELKPQG